MQQDVETFLNRYAQAYSEYDQAAVAVLFALPCLLLADDNRMLITDDCSLQRHLAFQFELYRSIGTTQISPQIQHQVRLSDNMVFVSVHWFFFGKQQQPLFNCHTSYTLQYKDADWHIVTIVTDDEQQAYQDVLLQHC